MPHTFGHLFGISAAMLHSTTIAIAMSGLLGLQSGGVEPRLLSRIREREGLKTIEVELTVHFMKYKISPEIEGGSWRIHQWYRATPNLFRFDEASGKNLGNGLPWSTRYAFDGSTYRLVENVDQPRYSSREYVNRAPEVVPDVPDARVIGIRLDSWLFIHNYQLRDVEKTAKDAERVEQESSPDGYIERYKQTNGVVDEFTFDRTGALVRYLGTSARTVVPPIRLEALLTYSNPPREGAYPSRIEFKRYDSQELTVHEIWDIKVVKVNRPIDLSICGWAALNPPAGARLVVDGDYQHVRGRWNGKTFVQPEAREKEVVLAPPEVDDGPTLNPWLLGLGGCAVLLACVLAYRFIRRSRKVD